MKPPTIEEVQLQAVKMGLSELEAQKFWLYYGSKGWLVGRSPMKNWLMALTGWKLRSQTPDKALSGIDKTILLKELERCESAMHTIKGSYSENLSWSPADAARFKVVKARREEIKSKLGILI